MAYVRVRHDADALQLSTRAAATSLWADWSPRWLGSFVPLSEPPCSTAEFCLIWRRF